MQKYMKIKEIVSAYKALGEAKLKDIEDSEIKKIVVNRKNMRSVVEAFDAFLKDIQEKFKPENWDQAQEKIQKWSELSDEEKIELNKTAKTYEANIQNVLKEEAEKEVEVTIETLSEETLTKLLKYNDWPVSKLDELSILV